MIIKIKCIPKNHKSPEQQSVGSSPTQGRMMWTSELRVGLIKTPVSDTPWYSSLVQACFSFFMLSLIYLFIHWSMNHNEITKCQEQDVLITDSFPINKETRSDCLADPREPVWSIKPTLQTEPTFAIGASAAFCGLISPCLKDASVRGGETTAADPFSDTMSPRLWAATRTGISQCSTNTPVFKPLVEEMNVVLSCSEKQIKWSLLFLIPSVVPN